MRTIEAAYWGIGVLIGIAVALLAAPIAEHWLQASALRRLEGMRSGDGGWPWFPGGRTCTPVTLSILSGFGRLRAAGVDLDIQPALATLPWLDGQFVEWWNEAKKRGKGEPTIDSGVALALYARSFFTADMPPQGEAAAAWLASAGTRR